MRKIISMIIAFITMIVTLNFGIVHGARGLETGAHIVISVNGENFDAVLYDTESANAFLSMLPMTIEMNELNSNEKYYYMDESLPTSTESVGQIHKGDLMLYGNSCVVFFIKISKLPTATQSSVILLIQQICRRLSEQEM